MRKVDHILFPDAIQYFLGGFMECFNTLNWSQIAPTSILVSVSELPFGEVSHTGSLLLSCFFMCKYNHF